MPTLLCVSAAALLADGCGGVDRPDIARVEGRVTLDGEPLANAKLVFQPVANWRASTGLTDDHGNYELFYNLNCQEKGATIGRHIVRISTVGRDEGEPEVVPVRYNEQTELWEEVESGTNEIDFGLTSD